MADRPLDTFHAWRHLFELAIVWIAVPIHTGKLMFNPTMVGDSGKTLTTLKVIAVLLLPPG